MSGLWHVRTFRDPGSSRDLERGPLNAHAIFTGDPGHTQHDDLRRRPTAIFQFAPRLCYRVAIAAQRRKKCRSGNELQANCVRERKILLEHRRWVRSERDKIATIAKPRN